MTKRERCFCSTARPSFEHQLDELVLKQELERRRLSIFAVSSQAQASQSIRAVGVALPPTLRELQ
jgi:hypothetical protein